MNLELLKKSIENGEYVVYDGDLIGWCTCKIIHSEKLGEHTRVLVETLDGTKLTRFLKEVDNISELSPNGCVYFMPKKIKSI